MHRLDLIMFNAELLNTIILLGAVQGFIFSAMLWFSKTRFLYNRLLSVLLLLLAMASLNIYVINQSWFAGSFAAMLFDAFIPLIVVMPLGPLLFFYVQALNNEQFRLGKKEKRQFYTLLLDIFPNIVALAYVLLVLVHAIRVHNAGIGNFIDDWHTYVDIPRWISLAVYAGLSYHYLQRKAGRSTLPSDAKKLRWAKQVVLGFSIFLLIWLLHLVPYEIPAFTNRLIDWGNWYPLYIPLSLLIYWLGIKGYLVSQQLTHLQKKEVVRPVSMPVDQAEQLFQTLQAFMIEKKPYLNPTLNLTRLSEESGIPAKSISEVLNRHLHKNFNEFINEYRVNEIIARILQPDSQRYTLTSIAFDCGFNSQPTFQRAFKSVKGLSPSEFIARAHSNNQFENS